MSLHSWLQKLRSALTPRRGQHPRRDSFRTTTHRPSLEGLEDRLTPSFVYFGSFPGGYPASALPQWADFTSDGIDDMIDIVGNAVAVRPGLGDGTFADPIYTSTRSPEFLSVADFNGDGPLDVVIASYGSPGIGDFPPNGYATVLLGRGDGTFIFRQAFNVQWPTSIWTEDFDGDGRKDVEVTGLVLEGGEQWFQVFRNDGNWDPPPPPPPPPPSVEVNNVLVGEGNAGTRAATFTLTLSSASAVDVTVHYQTGDSSAVAGSDYIATSGDVTIPAGQTSATFTVAVMGDRLPEPKETFAVYLTGATNATIIDGQGIGMIADDEPQISISDVSKREGRKNTTSFVFTVTLSAAYDQPVTMSFRTVDGTAKAGEDYVAQTGTLTFAPGETTKTITIEVKGDSKREADETFYLDLFANSGNSLFTKNRGLGTILNDD
jgi:hypothetical protein